jgi:hypothetical protein
VGRNLLYRAIILYKETHVLDSGWCWCSREITLTKCGFIMDRALAQFQVSEVAKKSHSKAASVECIERKRKTTSIS